MGLLVLLNEHGGSEDVALLADDLELELDEILPSVEFAEALGLLRVDDGRATLTPTGSQLLAGTISERRALIRELLLKTTLFRTLLRALEGSPSRSLSEEEYTQLLELTVPPSDDVIQTIVNWGRYAELFRYDSERRALIALPRGLAASGSGRRGRPPARPGETSDRPKGTADDGALTFPEPPRPASAIVPPV